jgi:hypothetical protein
MLIFVVCHPKRSNCFAKRRSYAVERPLRRHDRRPTEEFSPCPFASFAHSLRSLRLGFCSCLKSHSSYLLYNNQVPESANPRLDRVQTQLRLYEHPLLNFSARAKGDGVEIVIKFKDESVPVHTYYFDLHPRDLDDSQFEWSFQRQLYDALHDYFMEMFIRTPQDRTDRRQRGL